MWHTIPPFVLEEKYSRGFMGLSLSPDPYAFYAYKIVEELECA